MKKLSETTQGILSYLAVAGVLVIVVTAPYALAGIARLYASAKKLSPEQTQIRRIAQSLAAAKRSKLVIMSEKPDGKFLVELSEKGRRRLKEVEYENLRIPMLKPWDGKWRKVYGYTPIHAKTKYDFLQNCWGFLDLSISLLPNLSRTM